MCSYFYFFIYFFYKLISMTVSMLFMKYITCFLLVKMNLKSRPKLYHTCTCNNSIINKALKNLPLSKVESITDITHSWWNMNGYQSNFKERTNGFFVALKFPNSGTIASFKHGSITVTPTFVTIVTGHAPHVTSFVTYLVFIGYTVKEDANITQSE